MRLPMEIATGRMHCCARLNHESDTSKHKKHARDVKEDSASSTLAQLGKWHFLAYNMLGRGTRVPAITEYFGFTMAALNENGSVFSNPCQGENHTSNLMHRPFSNRANNSELEGEEVKAVALGTGLVAAVTSRNVLCIFTEGGLQRHILCLMAQW